MGSPETFSREPCPDRLVDTVGFAFSLGAVGGSIFHIVKGIKNSPSGKRIAGGLTSVRMNVPRISGSYAVRGGVFSVFDCTTSYLRQKEDPWNSIISGAATGGLFSMRQGIRASARSAFLSGLLLTLLEGSLIILNNFTPYPTAEIAATPPVVSTGPSSWFVQARVEK